MTIGTSLTSTAIHSDRYTSLHSFVFDHLLYQKPYYIQKTTRHLTSSLWFSTIPLVWARLQVVSTHIYTVFSDISLHPVSWINNVDRVFYLHYSSSTELLITHHQKSSLIFRQNLIKKYKSTKKGSFTINIYRQGARFFKSILFLRGNYLSSAWNQLFAATTLILLINDICSCAFSSKNHVSRTVVETVSTISFLMFCSSKS